MPDTAILVGSVELANQSLLIDGNPEAIAAGSYYLRHGTAGISLFDALELAMTNAGLAGVQVELQRNLLVRIQALGNFEITLSARLQRLLGFSGTQGPGNNSYEATLVSPLLWAPGYPATPASRAGKAGYKVPHVTRHKADDGSRQEAQYFGEEVWQELEWPFVPADLLQVADADDDGGSLEGLFEEVLKYNRPFQWYPAENTHPDSDSLLSWGTVFGPYQLRDDLGKPNWYDRIRANADDIGGGVGMKLHLVEELSNA